MGNVTVKRLRKIAGHYYWRPSATLRAAGWRSVPLGADKVKAVAEAERLNLRVEMERRGANVRQERAGTIADLVDRYMSDSNESWTRLKPASRRTYEVVLREIAKVAGDIKIGAITRKGLKDTYRALRKHRSDYVAALHMGVWAALMKFALDEEEIAVNPANKLGIRAPASRDVVWPAADMNAVIEAAESEGRHSFALAIRLLYETGQRPADIVALPWSAWDGTAFVIKQSKRGARVVVPVHPDTAARLAGMERRGTVVLVREDGKPWTVGALGAVLRGLRRRHGIDARLTIRDLRRTALTEMGGAGSTDAEIQSISGHHDRQMLSTYVRPDGTYAANAQAKRWKKRDEA